MGKQLEELGGATSSPATALASPSEVWMMRDLSTNPVHDTSKAVVPEMFEQWCWEGDKSVLPFKWEQAVTDCCDGQVSPNARRPWEIPGFDEQGIFFLTNRSDTCGIAVALPLGTDETEGMIAAW